MFIYIGCIHMYVPITTAMHEQMIMETERPANAHAYCEMRFPRPRVTPPAMAIRTEGQLSCICHLACIMAITNSNQAKKKLAQGQPE